MTAVDPVLITDDEALLGGVLRLAAAAGVAVEVLRRPDPGLRSWVAAPAVLVGADQAACLAALGPPRRGGVHVLSLGSAADGLFRAAVDVGAGSVLELPEADDRLVEMLTDVGDGGGRTAVTVGVVGGSGGVGASVLTAALGLTAARTGTAMLVDLDPLGPGLARLVGLDGPGVTWADLADSHGRLGARALREALPSRDGVGILGWAGTAAEPPSPVLVREVVGAGQRGHDWVVLDLPRSADPSLAGLVSRCDHVLLVVRAALGGVAAAARLADRLRAEAPDASLVVRARRGSPPAEDIARAVGLPLVGELREQRRLDEHLDLGLGPVHQRRSPLASTAAALVERWVRERSVPAP
jgi:secretion/DNA translocation related CpaE-like protein